jgi:hypothetical protein
MQEHSMDEQQPMMATMRCNEVILSAVIWQRTPRGCVSVNYIHTSSPAETKKEDLDYQVQA